MFHSLRITAAITMTFFVALACSSGSPSKPAPRPIPSPVTVRQEPDGITLGDPSFEALPGATADFGRLGGSVYQIEMPNNWNGRLALYMHGYGELAPEADVSGPAIRAYLVLHGYAWGASSFSSTSSIPGRAADETAALWDFFTKKYGRPQYTYVFGQSMGGAASHIAAERYGDRFDGALGLCGSAGQAEGAMQQADFFTAAADVAGVTQAEFDASTDVAGLVRERIMPALQDPATHERWEDIMIDLTGGPRSFDREGFHFEEETNWRRSQIVVTSHIAPNRDTTYRLGPTSTISSDEYNRDVIRLPVNDELMRSFTEGAETTGNLQMPLISLHTTGDGQVPIVQAQILQRRVDAAGKDDLLVQRVFRDPGHCGFTNGEWEANLEALVDWVEHGKKPTGENVLVGDLRALTGEFELAPRPGSPEADKLPGASDRVVVSGTLSVDGAPFDARFLGAVVRKDGLITPCQYTLPQVEDGRYEITVLAHSESSGCGQPGAEIFLWTFVQNQQLYSLVSVAWPTSGNTTTFDGTFSLSTPAGGVPPVAQFFGEAFTRDGERLPTGTRIEAYVGSVLCGVASLRSAGGYYILSVVGPDSITGCDRGATITFRVDGEPALQTRVNDPEGQERGPTDLIVR